MQASKSSSPRIYYGWWIAGASFIGLSAGQSPVAFISFGLFIKPISAEFGWGRGDISLALSIGAMALAFVTPFVGSLIDRVGARRLLIPSMIVFGLLIGSLYFLRSLWQLYLIYLLAGIGGAAANNVSYMRILSAWFDRRRGLAFGLASSAASVTIVVFLAQLVITIAGWRLAFVAMAAFVLLFALPIVAFIMRDNPADMGVNTDARLDGAIEQAEPSPSFRDLASRGMFWAMVAVGFMTALSLNGMQIHMVPMLSDRGIPQAVVVSSFSLVAAITSVIARIGAGWLFDRMFAPRVAMVIFLLSALGVLLLTLTNSPSIVLIVIAALLLGLGYGAEADVLGYLTSRYFGFSSFGKVYGCVFAAFMFGTALSPYLFGLIYDLTGQYTIPMAGSEVMLLTLCAILGVLPRFPAPDPGQSPLQTEKSLSNAAISR